jgi:hypothetical protein
VADAFVSYSRKDQGFVRELAKAFSARQRDAWIDWKDIPPTADWENEIHGGIEGAESFCFVISPDSLTSDVCARELSHAISQGKRIIPLLRREPGEMRAPPELASRNWILFRATDDFDEAVNSLVRALNTDLDWVRAHTRLLVRANEWEHNRRDGSLLMRGADLRDAEQQLASTAAGREPEPTRLQRQYVLASRRAAARRQRLTLAAVAAALAVSAVLGVLALLQRNEARTQARLATSRALAAEAVGALDVDPALSLALAVEATHVEPTPQAERALRSALAQSHLRRMIHNPSGPVNAVAFGADGRILASGDDTDGARLWDVKTGRMLSVLGPPNALLSSVTYGPKGGRWLPSRQLLPTSTADLLATSRTSACGATVACWGSSGTVSPSRAPRSSVATTSSRQVQRRHGPALGAASASPPGTGPRELRYERGREALREP